MGYRLNIALGLAGMVLASATALGSDPREPFSHDALPEGGVVEFTGHDAGEGEGESAVPGLVASEIELDEKEFSKRLYGGQHLTIPAMSRRLENERMYVRLPVTPDESEQGNDAEQEDDNEPPLRGLLVWINAGPGGGVPSVFTDAADELNLVIVGPANVGNDRNLSDRMQVCLDAVATVSDAVPIDASRVYVTGISGGGRVSSMLHICFPDVFTGSVPIVGVNCYARVPTGDGKAWPAAMKKPRGKLWGLLREQRIGPISGPPDFNHAQTAANVKRFNRDGLDAKYFEYPDQSHTLPTAERFAEALRWVDETWATRREARIEEAEKMVGSVERSMENTGREEPSSSHVRRLEKAIEVAPWTAVGDRARALLGTDGSD